jgi:hypothetical protein
LVLRLNQEPTVGFEAKLGETVATSFEAKLEKTVAARFKPHQVNDSSQSNQATNHLVSQSPP